MSTPRERRIAGELKQLFITADIVSIQDIDPKSIDVNDKNLMDIIITGIMEYIKMPRMETDKAYVLTVECRQIDKNSTSKIVKYIFIIPERYPFTAPIIKTDSPSGTYNGYGLPQVNISRENDIGSLYDNTVYKVAGIDPWAPGYTLLDIIKGSQSRELDPSIDIVVDSNSTFNIEKPKGGRRKTRRRKNKRSKKNKKR
jgi:hypothetical protein